MSRAPSREFVLVAGLLLAAVLLALALRPVAVLPPEPRAEGVGRAAAEPQGVRAEQRPERLRDVFAYDEPQPAPTAPPPASVVVPSPPPALTLPPASPVSLVGFVRQGSAVRAALSIRGEVSVLASGETAGGYLVVQVDEDRGVTLRGPDGAEVQLAPPSAR